MHIIRGLALAAAALLPTQPVLAAQPAGAAAPALDYAFTAEITLAPPVEQGQAAGGRKRFIAITGGRVDGPMLQGVVLPGGGDWQVIEPGGLTLLDARYLLKAADGTVIEITNPGVRVADPQVTERLARGEQVDPAAYYFRTTPHFVVPAGKFDWMRRAVFVARGIRRPDRVEIDVFIVR